MGSIKRFKTLDIGRFTVPGHGSFELRILQEADSSFYVLWGGPRVIGPHATAEIARAHACKDTAIEWRGHTKPCDGEVPCPICAAPVVKSTRYPRHVCGACIAEAVDRQGRPVRFANTELLGHGFCATLLDGSETEEPHDCYIRGVRCRADEAYFGGIAVQVADRPPR